MALIDMIRALGDETRIRIINLVYQGEDLCSCEIESLLELPQSNTSRHLTRLRQAGILTSYKRAQWVHYRLHPAIAAPGQWLLGLLREAEGSLELLRDDSDRLARYRASGHTCKNIHTWEDPMNTQQQKAVKKVLFLCTGNSCRSQMAEGWARALKGDVIEAYSAGITTHGLNPHAVAVMQEAGVDISSHRSKQVTDLLDVPFDYVITVCGHAHETCPRFPGAATKVVHHGFDDPPYLASLLPEDAVNERLDCYRRVRDEIRAYVEQLPEILEL